MIRELSDRFVAGFPFTWVTTNSSSSLERKSAMNHSQLQSSVAAAWRMQINAKWMLLLGRQFVICVDSSEQINQKYQAVKNRHHDARWQVTCELMFWAALDFDYRETCGNCGKNRSPYAARYIPPPTPLSLSVPFFHRCVFSSRIVPLRLPAPSEATHFSLWL